MTKILTWPQAQKLINIAMVTLFTFTLANAQTARVLSHNSSTTSQARPIVNIKWYHQQFIYTQGVNLYRRESGQEAWTKLNAAPILMQQVVPPALLQQDADLDAFLNMAKAIGTSDNEGFILLTLFAKSFQSQDYARLIGIQYDDLTAVWGKTYEYRVSKIEGKSETDLATSLPLRVGSFVAEDPVKDLHAAVDKHIVKMRWTEEENRFYGVNLYRNSSRDSTWVRLNKTPVVMSETEGAPAADAMFQDASVVEGTRYTYQITGLDFFGDETVLSEKVEVEVGDLTPPPPPIDPVKRVRKLNVTLSWKNQPAEDLAGFFIYRSRNSEGPYARINTALLSPYDTVYTDEVPRHGFYYYYIAATDATGNEARSNTIMAEVQDVIPPAAPQHVTAVADTGRITLQWRKNQEPDVVGYYIFRTINEDKAANFLLVNADPLPDTTYTQQFARNASNKFLFRIIAVDSAFNRSVPSATVAARMPDVTAPIKPLIKNIVQQKDSLIITWMPNLEVDLKGYKLYRYREGHANEIQAVSVITTRSTTRLADTVTITGRYYYQLEAIDESGNASMLSDPFPAKTTKAFYFVFNDMKAKYRKRKNSIELSWRDGTGVVGYTVYRRNDQDEIWRPVSGTLLTPAYSDQTIQQKMRYDYEVRAYADTGELVRSPHISVKAGK